MRRVDVDADGLAAYWLDRIERLLRASLRDLHLVPEAQRVDVGFGAFMADELGTVTAILARAGLGLTDDGAAELSAYVAGNPRGKNGRVVYDLRRDFHLEPAAVRERFAFYFDAFPRSSGGAVMRQVRVHGPDDVRVDEVDDPRPGARATRSCGSPACGICGTDLSYIHHGGWAAPGGFADAARARVRRDRRVDRRGGHRDGRR